MTVEDESKDIYVKMLEGIPDNIELNEAIIIAKRNAIVAIDEIIKVCESISFNYDLDDLKNTDRRYYNEIKQCLIKM